ncbi:MAG: 4'-phosphopantetheinyl transferase superfamily protein [Candidatus Symbiothrix sp.]|jgi:phosphopantetheinyl transferase|nr:4'-phosphopantetheinyl transferase superfamily protein [Candidatus Symbiothrix sp.]
MEPEKNHHNRLGVAPIQGTSDALLSQLEQKEWYLPALQKMREHRKCEWLSVRLLLKSLLGEEKQILYTDAGKPYLADHSYHISISHTKGFVAVALDKEKPVAVDIEYLSPRVEKIRTRFVNEAEESHLSKENRLIHLLLHWSAKESLFKLLDENDIDFKTQLHLNPFEPELNRRTAFTAYETRTEKQQTFTVNYFVNESYILTTI